MGARLIQPIVQEGVVGYEFAHLLIRAIDIFRIPGQRHPTERSFADAKQRTHVRLDESGISERIIHAYFLRHCPDVVAVIESDHTPIFKRQNGANLSRHCALRCFGRAARVALPALNPFLDPPSEGQIPVDRIVGRGLVRHYVGEHASTENLLINFGGISDKPDRDRLAFLVCSLNYRKGLIKAGSAAVEIAGALAELDAARLAFDDQNRRARHRGRQRLGATHAAKSTTKKPTSRKRSGEVATANLRKRFVCALNDPLRSNIDPRASGHLAVHHEPFSIELVEMLPRRPVRDEIAIRDDDPWRARMRRKDAYRLAGLNQQCLILAQLCESRDDLVEAIPIPRGAADPTIYH